MPVANPLTSGVSYTYIGELEKSVVLVMGNAGDTVVSTIHKDHVEVFCGTHNDAAKADRKSRRDDERRALLVPGARIRVRTASGIYEVTLARVVDEQNGVEVMWEGDTRKMYKFGSVVWKEDTAISDGVFWLVTVFSRVWLTIHDSIFVLGSGSVYISTDREQSACADYAFSIAA